ncbi:NADP-dependent alcohol dehydrogenase [Alkalibacterium subtropicum]|uniref:NADP-dependent alcohol dehydrogenase n=1 Tax=Alkalibacterium subtropicum TaxID=753702 RepID=A0A1I1GVK8_9LACT|nr:iron-containing alcohol dehydrogenase [Alkalibacterium subtropicum]SFC13030.1 NADP-dependent alcohol dehydrogenase [Alkalibacterium subtropicum]
MEKAMSDFVYYNPVKVLFGRNKISELGALIPDGKKVLITYGGGSVKRFGTLDRVKEALHSHIVGEFGGIEANPTYSTCMEAVERFKEGRYDYLLAVGGGSVIDATKFIAAAIAFDGDPKDIFGQGVGKGLPVESAVPFGSVLTLPATASEMNETSVITFKEEKAKISFSSRHVFPEFSILEPELTYTLPKRQLANGITDAFVHVIEQYLTYPVNGMVQDEFAEGLLRVLIEIGPDVVDEDNHDYALRANYMWTATLALNRLISRGVPGDWSTHGLGHEITVLNNTDHARSLSAILPAVMVVRKLKKWDKLVQYAEKVWGITEGTEEAKIDAAILKTVAFFKSIGMPTNLSDVGVDEADIDTLVRQLKDHGNEAISERGDQTLDVSCEIYQKALDLNF